MKTWLRKIKEQISIKLIKQIKSRIIGHERPKLKLVGLSTSDNSNNKLEMLEGLEISNYQIQIKHTVKKYYVTYIIYPLSEDKLYNICII